MEVVRASSIGSASQARAGVSRRLQGLAGSAPARLGMDTVLREMRAVEPAISSTEARPERRAAMKGRERVGEHHRFSNLSGALAGFGAQGSKLGGRRRATPASSRSGFSGHLEAEWSHSGIGTAVGFARAGE